MLSKIQEIREPLFRWVHLTQPGDGELDWLRQRYPFHPLDLEDVRSAAQHPKLDEYEQYLFLILTFPVYNRAERRIESSELCAFLGRDYLVTVGDGRLPALDDLLQLVQTSAETRDRLLGPLGGTAPLLHELLNRLLLAVFPMLEHVSQDIATIEQHIFAGYEKRMVREILIVKRNIVYLRKIMQSHKKVIRRLLARGARLFPITEMDNYFQNLVEETKDIWDTLDNQKEIIDALQETNEALISFQLNDIIKILTIISVILLPVGLIPNLLGARLPGTPLVEYPFGFLGMLGIMGLLAIGLALYFKRKRWL